MEPRDSGGPALHSSVYTMEPPATFTLASVRGGCVTVGTHGSEPGKPTHPSSCTMLSGEGRTGPTRAPRSWGEEVWHGDGHRGEGSRADPRACRRGPRSSLSHPSAARLLCWLCHVEKRAGKGPAVEGKAAGTAVLVPAPVPTPECGNMSSVPRCSGTGLPLGQPTEDTEALQETSFSQRMAFHSLLSLSAQNPG